MPPMKDEPVSNEKRKTNPVGILIGLALPLGSLSAEQRTALNAPTYTAAAFVNKKLSADLLKDLPATLRKAERWSNDRYLPALARRSTLSDTERDDVAI